MNRDEEHRNLLGVFHYVVAALAGLMACVPMIHLLMGVFILSYPGVFKDPNGPPPEFLKLFGWMFVLFAGFGIAMGWAFAGALAYAGHCLRRRKHRLFCIVMGGLCCMFFPFGTVLGAFTLVVRIRPSVAALFEGAPQPAAVA